jgi:hypothetical protein
MRSDAQKILAYIHTYTALLLLLLLLLLETDATESSVAV